jgi:mRNA interferase RelE/StbE
MASYRIEWRSSTKKDLRKIEAQDRRRILTAVEALESDPFPPGCTKLTGSEQSYRIRTGNYRILYDVHSGHLVIEVIKVGHRKDVYRT